MKSTWLTMAALLAALCAQAAAGPLSAQTQDEMRKMFERFPDKFPAEVQRGFYAQQVVPGMDPYTAHLAGGAFAYRVDADPQRWPSGADPYRVMWGQSMHPDHSHIWMSFENDTQYPGEGRQRFTAYVEDGKVQRVERTAKPAG
ncbi:hypothetical protein ACLB1G_11830 [Oxalobacteraceae bacterium A2-2]